MRSDEDSKKGIPTISRVAGDTLVELVYDPAKRATGLIVSRFGGLWNLEQEVHIGSELLVPYSASNNLIANNCVSLPSLPVHYGVKDELLADISAFLHRYVDLSPIFEQIAAHYILLTWVYDRFGEVPYLRLRGEYGTGKTRALLAIGSLCNKAFFASGASTTSPIFHTQDAFGGTLVLDEADFAYSDAKSDIVKILNNGSVAGMPVLRTILNRSREFNPAAFRVFGPKIIAMRDSFQDRALESRFLTEETGSRPLRPDIPLHLPPEMKAEALTLRNRLLHFRLSEFFNINTDPTARIEGVEPRINQTALSLLSLVDDPETKRSIQQALRDLDASIRTERQQTAEAGVLRAALAAFAEAGRPYVSLRDIALRFNADQEEGTATSRWIGYMLRTRFRALPRKSNGIYVLPADQKPLLDAGAARLGFDGDFISSSSVLEVETA
jgi:hypothetical protein